VQLLRTLTTWHCPHPAAAMARLLLTAGPPAMQQSIDIYCLSGSQQTRLRVSCAAVAAVVCPHGSPL